MHSDSPASSPRCAQFCVSLVAVERVVGRSGRRDSAEGRAARGEEEGVVVEERVVHATDSEVRGFDT